MEELVFLALLVVFTILEAVFKKRRQAGEGPDEPEEVGVDAGQGDGRPEGSRVEPWEMGGGRLPAGPREEPAPYEPASSEELVPRDIWEEIAALARGDRSESGAGEGGTGGGELSRGPERSRPSRSGDRREPVPSTSPVRRGQVGRGEIGRGGGIGRRPAAGRTGLERDLSRPSPAEGSGRGRARDELGAVRRALVEGGAGEARKAVILHEVLGKPLAYRDGSAGGSGE